MTSVDAAPRSAPICNASAELARAARANLRRLDGCDLVACRKEDCSNIAAHEAKADHDCNRGFVPIR